MSRLVLVLLFCVSVLCDEQPSNREEKLRSALIDAFQNIKKASAKGGIDEESPLNADLIGSILPNASRDQPIHEEEPLDLFSDDDGLTFAEAFGEVENSSKRTSTETSHNVQHIVKTTKEKTTQQPNKESILHKISDSIRNAVNESKNSHLKRESPSNESLFSGIDSMLRILDAEVLVQQWKDLQKEVSGSCKQNLQLYIDGLLEKKLWARKMDDAGGRYTTMFYWGNNYWMGSQELCAELNDRELSPRKNTSTGSQIFNDWRGDISATDDGPPFPTMYFVARLTLNTDNTISENKRTVHLGLCLPRACDKAAISRLLSATRSPFLKQTVLAVRTPLQNEYMYIEDPTFQLLVAAVCFVSVFLVAGTAYDMKLARDVRRRRRRAANMAAAENGGSDDGKRGLEAITVSKGKSMYNVNNNIAINSNNSEERLTTETSYPQEEITLSVWSEILLSFSVKANVLQIFDQSVGADTVSVLHGLRTFSMIWVIFGHTCIVVFKYADNTALRAVLEQSFWFQLVISAVYSVDTFFCLGGVLVTFLYFRTNAKGSLDRLSKGKKKLTAGFLHFIGLLAYRFARLTAPYMLMVGVVTVTMKWFSENAVFEPPALDHETCPQYWWRNLLFINTLFPVHQMCMLWSWYISDDTQFYAVTSIVLILATTHMKWSMILTGLLFISSLLTTGYVSWSSQHIPTGEDPFTQFDKIYDKPWTRFGPYLVGTVTGWILFKTNLRIPMNRVCVTIGWTISTSTLLFLIFGLYGSQLGVLSAAVYSALSHSLWAAAVGWIIVACSTGHGGWVSRLLSSPLLYPWSRCTYCAYLVHPVVLRALAATLTQPLHLSAPLVFVIFLGVSVISYVLAFAISVAFEAPVVTMLKILSPQRKPHRV